MIQQSLFSTRKNLLMCWRSLGLLFGALGGHLGALWGVQIDPKWLRRGDPFRLGTLLDLVSSLLAAEDGIESVLGPFGGRFWCSQKPFELR